MPRPQSDSTRRPFAVPATDRERALATRGTFLFHLRPVRLSSRAARWSHTFGLGGSALVLWVALAASGILLLLVYQPVPDVAWDSVGTLEGAVRFGPLVRGVHYWSSNLLIVVVLLHVARVVLTGGFHRPRRVNWLVGAALLLFVLAAAFTGYLLPWDQRAYWAITISTGMLSYVPLVGEALQHVVRGGAEIGSETLLTFYTFHTTVLPVLLVCGMAFHFWRVRKAGGVVEPHAAEGGARAPNERILFFPDLLVREAAQALVVLAVVVVLGAFVGATMGARANPGMSPNPAKAPWYFMGFQELLIHLHPTFAVLVWPAAAALGFLALPLLGDGTERGRWFLDPGGARIARWTAAAAVAVTGGAVIADESLGASGGAAGAWLIRGLIPTLALLGLLAGLWGLLRRRGVGRDETLQALVVFLFVAFATLTLIGVFFRGEGMALTTPWARP